MHIPTRESCYRTHLCNLPCFRFDVALIRGVAFGSQVCSRCSQQCFRRHTMLAGAKCHRCKGPFFGEAHRDCDGSDKYIFKRRLIFTALRGANWWPAPFLPMASCAAAQSPSFQFIPTECLRFGHLYHSLVLQLSQV